MAPMRKRRSRGIARELRLVWKRPKRLLLKAAAAQRAAFVEQYRQAVAAMERRSGRLFFVDEAHFRADGDCGLGEQQIRLVPAQFGQQPQDFAIHAVEVVLCRHFEAPATLLQTNSPLNV